MPPPSGSPPDHAARSRATTEFARNLVVTAGAGTGKTAILVERTLNMIGSGEAALDRLALITFTDKAAAELRQRLGSGLDRLLRRATGDTSPPDPKRDADRSWSYLVARGTPAGDIRTRVLAALAALDAASVGTIHAFCMEILRRHPREAVIDPGAAVGEDAALEGVFDEAWDLFLRGPDGPGRRAEAWRQALGRHAPPSLIHDLGLAMSSFTLPAAALDPYVPPPLREVLGAAIDDALGRIRDVRGRARGMPGKMTGLLETAEEALSAVRHKDLDAALARSLAEQLAPYPGVPAHGAKLSGATPEEVKGAARIALDLLRPLLEIDEAAVAAAHEAARPLAVAARARTLSRGLLPFDAMLRLARELLAGHPEVRRQVRARFRQLLVDEFQDTDPLQYEVLFFLAGKEGAGPADDAWRTDLEPGRLFIVGDPKQSIYRFRRADIAAFRRAVERILACGGDELRLTASFRSPSRLLDPINRLFAGWLGPEGAWQGDHAPPYIAIEPAGGAEPAGPPRVRIWSVDAGPGADAGTGRRAEAAAIAAHIVERTRAAAADRRSAGDFAILFRALTNVGLYARALQRAGVPCIVEGGRDFAERPEVGHLLSFLRAVANPNDGPALLAVLRSPLGAVPDGELAAFVRDHRFDALQRVAGGTGDGVPDTTRFPALQRAMDLLTRFRTRTSGMPPDRVIQAALADTPLAFLHATAHDGAQRLANLRKCGTMTRQHADQGLTLAEILAEIESAFAADRGEGESPLADETLDAVRILSVHKAKGLEFKVVFVPDLGRGAAAGRGAETGAAWLRTADGGGQLAVRLADGRRNAAAVLHAIESARHEEAEERRVLYVACTRAQEELVLVNSRSERAAPWRDRLSALGYVLGEDGTFPDGGALAGGLVEHRVITGIAELQATEAVFDPGPFVTAAETHAGAAGALAEQARPPLAWPSGTREDDRAGDEASGPRTSLARQSQGVTTRQVARLAGLAVHAALEGWDFRDRHALEARGHAAARRLVAQEAGAGAGAAGLAAAVTQEVGAILEGFLASSLPRRLAGVDIMAREAPILHRDDAGRTWTGACDLVWREPAGGIVVADYKTDLVSGDALRAAQGYGAQMAVYLGAVRAAFPGEAIRGVILFVRTGEECPLEGL